MGNSHRYSNFKTNLKLIYDRVVNTDFETSLTIAEEVINTAQAFIKEPSFFSALKGCLVLYRQFDSIGIYVNEYFDSNWDKMYGVALADFIIDNISSSCKVKTIHTQDKDLCIKEAIVDGEKVSWATTTSGPSRGSSGNVFARVDRLEESKRAVKKLLWQNMKHDFIVMQRNNTPRDDDNPRIWFQKDEDIPSHPSELADKYVSYLTRTIAADVPRTILFYGPPGTGKSTLSRSIVDKLKLKTLRIRVEDVSNLVDNTNIFETIEIFEPDAIILDDLDRANSQDHLLEMLERFHNHVKVVFATVNDRNQLDNALMRPGRFDEICCVRKLDDIVAKTILGEDNLDVFDDVKNWPIAFIREYVIRRRFMNKEEALSSMKELQKRVDRLLKNDDLIEEENENPTPKFKVKKTSVKSKSSAKEKNPKAVWSDINDQMYVDEIKESR